MKIEIRGECVHISGYVNAVGRDSRPIPSQTGKFVEMIEPGTFGKALERAENVDLLLNHNKDRKLGSTSVGNLALNEDSIGLRAEADIKDAEVVDKARSGKLRGWSFGMYVKNAQLENRAEDIPRRHVREIDLFEVSLIDDTMNPCYIGTSVECRADTEQLIETRGTEDSHHEINEIAPPDYSDYEGRINALRAMGELRAYEERLQELRYNPYHDPTNGRFTGPNGAGGGMLFVGKGQKGKGQYVFDSNKGENFDDDEYEKWKASKAVAKRELDSKQIDRANAQGSLFYEAGTAIKNTYDREYDEIDNLNISDEEKATARKKIYEFSAAELQARQNYYDLYTAGPARKVSGSDKAFDKSQKIRSEHELYMAELRNKSSKNTFKEQKEKEAELFVKAGAEADKIGAREMTVNGETWFRTTKTSKTWTKGTLKDYKAQQLFKKSQQGTFIGNRKSWSDLSEEEKQKYYRALPADDEHS